MFSKTSAADKNNSTPEVVRTHTAGAAEAITTTTTTTPPTSTRTSSATTTTITSPSPSSSSAITFADVGDISQSGPLTSTEQQPAPSDTSRNNNNNYEKTNIAGSSPTTSPPSSSSTPALVRYGKCKWFNVAKGWGFITPNDGGTEVFVHQSVIQMTGFRSLGAQEDVEFESVVTPRGVEATRVAGREGIDCVGSTVRPRPHGTRFVRRVRCYNCNKFNHIAAECRLEPQPRRCYLCQQEDHLIADCPRNKTQTEAESQDAIQAAPLEEEPNVT